eukprot:TRINITY_DN970_c0_g1_i1.p1 TRINITY_DN970_c0_g1~~TRINITY_DN970_c0_g1_i1.p1  ORF type:complete len:612 (-),score=97.53 TRINITY_DN970_c0_g1_i1:774-2609(-)
MMRPFSKPKSPPKSLARYISERENRLITSKPLHESDIATKGKEEDARSRSRSMEKKTMALPARDPASFERFFYNAAKSNFVCHGKKPSNGLNTDRLEKQDSAMHGNKLRLDINHLNGIHRTEPADNRYNKFLRREISKRPQESIIYTNDVFKADQRTGNNEERVQSPIFEGISMEKCAEFDKIIERMEEKDVTGNGKKHSETRIEEEKLGAAAALESDETISVQDDMDWELLTQLINVFEPEFAEKMTVEQTKQMNVIPDCDIDGPFDLFRDPRLSELKDNERTPSKPNLILDIDHTLIQGIVEANRHEFARTREVLSNHELKSSHIERKITIGDGPQRNMMLIFRREVLNFLSEMSKHFKVYIYSHGRTEYVQQILSELDPKRDFVQYNWMFTNDGTITRTTVKQIERLGSAEINASNSIILDDTFEVWVKDQRRCLIPSKVFMHVCPNDEQHRRDRYAIVFEKRFILSDSSLFVENLDHPYPQLQGLRDFLIRVSHRYQKAGAVRELNGGPAMDVRPIFEEERRSILRGCRIHMHPNDEYRNFFSAITQMLGGEMTFDAKEATHSITPAPSGGPLRSTKFVKPRWLLDSLFCHRRMDENQAYYAADVRH